MAHAGCGPVVVLPWGLAMVPLSDPAMVSLGDPAMVPRRWLISISSLDLTTSRAERPVQTERLNVLSAAFDNLGFVDNAWR